jgi:hypothetical protein
MPRFVAVPLILTLSGLVCNAFFLSLEPTSHELRQAIAITATVLQEGNYEEDRAKPTASLPVLPSLLSVACLFNQTSHRLVYQFCHHYYL